LGIALDEPNEGDEQLNSNGIDIIFDKRDKDYFHHTTIDYEKSFFGKGFVVRSASASAC
jgi:Fe-S cluster assembly iron-binding protein IscA